MISAVGVSGITARSRTGSQQCGVDDRERASAELDRLTRQDLLDAVRPDPSRSDYQEPAVRLRKSPAERSPQ